MRRLLITTATGVLSLGLVAGCSSGGSGIADNVKVDKNGKHLTVTDGDNSISVGDAKLPASFPKRDVPLPAGGTLKAVVSGKRKGDEYYSLTYGISGTSLPAAGKSYKAKLSDAGYRIEASSSVGGASGSFSAFTARGSDWDVVVYSGGAGTNGALSLQVTPHDASTDPTGAGDTGGATTG